MAMNDEETVALIAGGHTFGKTHGAGDASLVGLEPEAAPIEAQGPGLDQPLRLRQRRRTRFTGGPEVTWTQQPTKWSNLFFKNLFENEWELTKSPAGAFSGRRKASPRRIPDAHDPLKQRVPTMLTTDISLRVDPATRRSRDGFYENPSSSQTRLPGVVQAHAPRHGPESSANLGPLVRRSAAVQDPIRGRSSLIGEQDIAALKAKILSSDLSVSSWSRRLGRSASTFRGSDKRRGANGARIRLAPRKDSGRHQPAQLAQVLRTLEEIQKGSTVHSPAGKRSRLLT